MTALIALQNEKTVQSIVDILNAMGMEARICREYDEFVECLKEKPEIVVSEPSIQDNSVLELIAEKPWSRWIIQDHFSWAAADFLCSQVGCYDILMDITSTLQPPVYSLMHFQPDHKYHKFHQERHLDYYSHCHC